MATYYVRPDGNNANTGLADSAAGAWQTIPYAVQFASNAVLANGDTVYVVGDQGSYIITAKFTIDRNIYLRPLRGRPVLDGTGGGAGADIVGASVNFVMSGFDIQNAVDRGVDVNVGAIHSTLQGLKVTACGGVGIAMGGGSGGATDTSFCQSNGNGSHGFTDVNGTHHAYRCSADSNTGAGFGRVNLALDCIATDNGTYGFHADVSANFTGMQGCTAEGNTGDGLRIATATPFPAFGNAFSAFIRLFLNCSFTNNGGYGVNCSAGALSGSYFVDYCNFYGNATAARNNFNTGENDLAVDPQYVNAAGDDYTLDTGSPLIAAGFPYALKAPAKLNIGATIAEVAAAAAGGGPALERGLAG